MKAVIFSADWQPRKGYQVSEQELQSGKATIASQVYRNPRFAWAEVPDPEIGPDEVLLRIRACGICGSDTHCYEQDDQGYVLFSGPLRAPVVSGHEFSASVVAVGRMVRQILPGMLVAGEGMLGCGVCEACRIGQPNQCPHLEMLGFSAPGAFAEYLVTKERFLWPLDRLAERMGDDRRACEVGALIEPLACSYNGMFVAAGGFRPGAHVAIFGCGPIGLGAIALARLAGAATVIAFDISADRTRIALQMGADEAHDPRAVSAAEAILGISGGWGADMLVEAAGAALQTMSAIEQAFAPGGRLVYLGRTGQKAPLLLDALVSHAASIHGARGHVGNGCFPRIIRLLERGRLDPSPMVTRRVPFADTLDALARSCDRTDAKIMVSFD